MRGTPVLNHIIHLRGKASGVSITEKEREFLSYFIRDKYALLSAFRLPIVPYNSQENSLNERVHILIPDAT